MAAASEEEFPDIAGSSPEDPDGDEDAPACSRSRRKVLSVGPLRLFVVQSSSKGLGQGALGTAFAYQAELAEDGSVTGLVLAASWALRTGQDEPLGQQHQQLRSGALKR